MSQVAIHGDAGNELIECMHGCPVRSLGKHALVQCFDLMTNPLTPWKRLLANGYSCELVPDDKLLLQLVLCQARV